MNCEQFDKITMDLLYGELDELNASAAQRHLHHCQRCHRIYSELTQTKDAFQLPLEEAPEGLLEDILALEAEARTHLPLSERIGRSVSVLAEYAMRPQLAMAAVLLLMVGMSILFIRGQNNVERTLAGNAEAEAPDLDAALTVVSEGARVYRSEDGESAEFTEGDEYGDDEAESLALAEARSREIEEEKSEVKAPSYAEAMTAYQEGRYATAERLFAQVAAAGDAKAASAALHEAHAARNGSGCSRAAPLYEAVARQFSGSTIELEARWHSASCYRALGRLELAKAQLMILSKSSAYQERAEKALASLEAESGPAKGSTEGAGPADASSATAGGNVNAAASSSGAADVGASSSSEPAAMASRKAKAADSSDDAEAEAAPSAPAGAPTPARAAAAPKSAAKPRPAAEADEGN